MQMQSERPPYVTFETRAVEDRTATVETGIYTTTDVDFAVITPQGSKDRIEKQANDWFQSLGENVQAGRFPQVWFDEFQARFKAWKAGQEMPENGTSVRNWPALSPSQVKSLVNAHLLTIEDLAAANEEAIARIGMGGRALKDRAVAWLTSAQDIGKTSERLAALQLANEQLTADNKALGDRLNEVLRRLDQLQPPAPTTKKL